MIYSALTEKGATLFESLLVLVVGGTLLVFGIQAYQSYQSTLEIQQLRYKVDQLFEATANYYQANCAAGDISPKPPNSGGITYPPTATSYYPVSIVTKLVGQGYLKDWNPSHPLVDPSGGESGYVVQLNPMVTSGVSTEDCVVLSPGTACVSSTMVCVGIIGFPCQPSTIPAAQAKIVTWAIQVAVKVKNPQQVTAYMTALGADCASSQAAGYTPAAVHPCPSIASGQDYVVFRLLPSFSSLKKGSPFNFSMPLLKQFNQQYTHDQNYELNSGYNASQAPVYYLCGG